MYRGVRMIFEKNKVYLGDCLDLMKDIPDKSIDFILCDLPYGTTACSWDSIIPLDPLWTQYNRVIKNNCAIALFASKPFTFKLFNRNEIGYKYSWYWNKNEAGNFAIAKYQPLRVVEEILIFGSGSVRYRPQMVEAETKNIRPITQNCVQKSGNTMGKISNFSHSEIRNNYLRFPKNIININSNDKECNNTRRLHPTQKPISLCEYLIKSHSEEGDLILDNCIGSGSTGIAALNLKRNFIGIEKDETYYNIAKDRISRKE